MPKVKRNNGLRVAPSNRRGAAAAASEGGCNAAGDDGDNVRGEEEELEETGQAEADAAGVGRGAGGEEEYKCSICLERVFMPVSGSCPHIFCRLCLIHWLVLHPGCPLCRQRADRLGTSIVPPTVISRHPIPEEGDGGRPNNYSRYKEVAQQEMSLLSSIVKWVKDKNGMDRLHLHIKSLALVNLLKQNFSRIISDAVSEGVIKKGDKFTVHLSLVNFDLCHLIVPGQRVPVVNETPCLDMCRLLHKEGQYFSKRKQVSGVYIYVNEHSYNLQASMFNARRE